ncbi:MAG: hypothetical protein ACI4TL_04880 [Candidatus Cryptobacteroides sp.]
MKKVLLFMAGALLLCISCEKVSSTDDAYTDLSAKASANCYLISKAGDYHFDAEAKGNGSKELRPASAELVWESQPGLISEIELKDGDIYFTVNGESGNALIAARGEDSEIIWSWHIWFPKEEPKDVLLKSGYTMLNMNLGALAADFSSEDDVDPYGLLYQWGRKDPFPSSPERTGDLNTVGYTVYGPDGKAVSISNSPWTDTENNTLAYSIAHPTVCLSNYAQFKESRDWLKSEDSNDELWGKKKTIYDPCPVGYKVSPDDAFKTFTNSGAYTVNPEEFDVEDLNGDMKIDETDYKFGWYFKTENGSSLFPAAARYDGSYAMLMGSKSGVWGSYWSCVVRESSLFNGGASVALSFMNEASVLAVSATASAAKADAYSVRCVKE